MKFSCKAGDLVDSLKRILWVIERKNTVPILGYILIEKDPEIDWVKLNATDLDTSGTTFCPQLHSHETVSGATCAPAAGLMDMLKTFPRDATIDFSEKEGILAIGCGDIEATLTPLNPVDFPHWDHGAIDSSIMLKSDVLAGLINDTSFAISTEQTRYYLNGICLETDKDKLRLTATDGHRLSTSQASAIIKGTSDRIIWPRKPALGVERLLTEFRKEPIEIRMDYDKEKQKLTVSWEGTWISAKMIDGTFPDYWRVVPKEFKMHVRVDRLRFAAAVKRCMAVYDDKDNPVVLEFNGAGKLIVGARKHGKSVIKESLEAAISGEYPNPNIGLNGRYLTDLINAVKGPAIEFDFVDYASPCRVRDFDHQDWFAILMPMRV